MRRDMKIFLIIMLLIVLLKGTAVCATDNSLYSQEFVKGLESIKQQNFEEAYKFFSVGSKKGDKECDTWLGMLLADGRGVKKNIKLGLETLKKAADAGSTRGQAEFGRVHMEGRYGVPKNPQRAMEYYDKAIAGGGVTVYLYLAMGYENGDLGKKDINKAIEMYKLAAKNYPYAQEKLEELNPSLNTAKDLISEAKANRMRFDKNFKSKHVRVSGYVGEIKPDRNAFTMLLFGEKGDLINPFDHIECHFSVSEEDELLDLNRGNSVTIIGMYKGKEDFEVGEFVLYDCKVVK